MKSPDSHTIPNPTALADAAAWLLRHISVYDTRATVVGLSGQLGAGKTTLTQHIARELGVTETVASPTFVIAKWYDCAAGSDFDQLIHIDAYRIDDPAEMITLGFAQLITQAKTLIIIEWPERIAGILPENTTMVSIEIRGDESRELIIN